MQVLVAGVKHPATLPSCRYAERAQQRDIEQRHLTAVAMPVLKHIFRNVWYGAVVACSCPRIARHNPVVNHACLLHRIGFIAHNALGKFAHLLIWHYVGIFGCCISAIQLTLLVVRLQVALQVVEAEILTTHLIAQLHAELCGLPRLGRCFHIHRVVHTALRHGGLVRR